MGYDRALAGDQPTLILKHRTVSAGEPVAWKALVDLKSGQNLVGQAVEAGRGEGPLKKRVVFRAGVDRSRDDQEFLARHALDLAPEFVGAAQQRNIGRILVIGQPNDAADPMRRPHAMGNVEALEAEHAL